MSSTNLVFLWILNVGFLFASDLNPITNMLGNLDLRVDQSKLRRAADFDRSELQKVNEQIEAVLVDIEGVKEEIKEVKKLGRKENGVELAQLREHLSLLLTKENLLQEQRMQLRAYTGELEREYKLRYCAPRSIMTESKQEFKFLPLPASLCTASKGQHCMSCLYNGMKPASFNLPGVVWEFLKTQVADESVRCARSAICQGLPLTMFPEIATETMKAKSTTAESLPSIQKTTGSVLKDYFTCHQEPKLACYIKSTLAALGAEFGPAKGASQPDGLIFAEVNGLKCSMACYELKDTSTAPLEQTGQTFASGANIALSQKAMGLDSSKIAVPLIMTNGQLYLFAAVSLLDFVPVLHILTGVLDVNQPAEMDQTACWLGKVRTFITKQAMELPAFYYNNYEIQKFTEELPLDTGRYFLKSKDKVFNRFSLLDREWGALPLLWDVFEALSGVEGVEKALGYGEFLFIGDTSPAPAIVFNNIQRDGYVMGVPIDEVDYAAFLEALESLVHQVHARGVIHVDLYPSNILWAKVEGKIRVRIVDWDGATFINENFSKMMLDRIAECPDRYFLDGSTMATPRNDAWHLFILSQLSEAQRSSLLGASAEDAPRVINAYSECVSQLVQQLRDPGMVFTEWYKGFEARGIASRQKSWLPGREPAAGVAGV